MRTLALLALLAAVASSQTPARAAFEVASVKINQQGPSADRALRVEGDTLTMRNLNMRVISAWAYNVQWSQIAGPAWVDSDRFDIIAKAVTGAVRRRNAPHAPDALRGAVPFCLAP